MRADLVEVATPFCHGLPGSMNAVSICAVGRTMDVPVLQLHGDNGLRRHLGLNCG